MKEEPVKSEDILKKLLTVAQSDDCIRAVLLNGSRANPKAIEDKFQDFDVVYVVRDISSFVADHSWINIFGERIILQMPDTMTFGERSEVAFHYLMLFKKNYRIDLTLYPNDKLEKFRPESLTIVLLDKDQQFSSLPPPSVKDYLITPPAEDHYKDCCNEFWWVSTNVAKGLVRNELTYAMGMLEWHVRPMFLKMIEWYIGIATNFSVSFGTNGRFMEKHISPELYEKILATYCEARIANVWKALFMMTEVFSDLAKKVSGSLNIQCNNNEEIGVLEYLRRIHEESSA